MQVLTIGTFDIPHAGHAAFLSKAASLGDSLLVGVLSDSFVKEAKGQLPTFNQAERMALVSEMGYETYLEVGGEKPLTHPLKAARLAPCIVAVGSDWLERDYVSRLGIPNPGKLGITLAYIPYTKGISTSEIVRRVRASTNCTTS